MSWLRNGFLRLFMSKEAREKMDAYHSVVRRGPQLGKALASSPEPMSEQEMTEAVDAAVARIALAEGIDRTGRIDPAIHGTS